MPRSDSTPTERDLTPQLRKKQAALETIPPAERSAEDGVRRETRRFRGLSLEQATGSLASLGGERVESGVIEGAGWRADLSAERVPVGPSYRLTAVTIEWTGEKAVLEPLVLRFRLKAFRAPG